ncbi:tryptophan--tRNA ligase [Pseudothauera nasutitermitis]|uniref:Tryptophan--tRNA ligase n=1 Tax=Pseudothauera nasutitermitis TaxID=2565930 RepID=A0A4S4B415_9RHOO|nr:tryptophan--tRNA ligase [Pseudothauera nasutitermitis]THF67437.1 tryptophan--tRNA ligase [Pseudothauera nasutitermitis]
MSTSSTSSATPPVQRVLTGIKPTGTPHLGNYAGALRPAIEASRRKDVESFYFLADYHALIQTTDPLRVVRSTLEITATWLAAGLDTSHVALYRQSDIPEIPELTWLLTCMTGKGLLNRAHAYKAAVDKNTEAGEDPDAGVTMGLYMYPVLMAADILMFKSNSVPVGRDQIQHIEMARDIATRFNHQYGEHFVLPEAAIDENVATLPGLDGRKMSKSYDNVIPLFAAPAELKKLIFSMVTDSRKPGEPKDTEGSALFQLYQAFADEAQTAAMRQAFADGIAWGDAKQVLFEQIDRSLAPMRERYHALIAEPAKIEACLREGAERARAIATPFLAELRHAVGLRRLDSALGATPAAATEKSAALPQFKQYRDNDGLFYFKLVDGDGTLLLQSTGFNAPRDAGQTIGRLKQVGATVAADGGVSIEGQTIGALAEGCTSAALQSALDSFNTD